MSHFTTKQITDKNEWESFLTRHEEANFLQSWYWGAFHDKLGHRIIRTGFFNGEALCGIMLSVVESAKRGKYLTVPAGPIIDWNDTNLVSTSFATMKQI